MDEKAPHLKGWHPISIGSVVVFVILLLLVCVYFIARHNPVENHDDGDATEVMQIPQR